MNTKKPRAWSPRIDPYMAITLARSFGLKAANETRMASLNRVGCSEAWLDDMLGPFPSGGTTDYGIVPIAASWLQ